MKFPSSPASIPPTLSLKDINIQLSNFTADELKEMEDIYQFQRHNGWQRATGWLNLALGALTILLGLWRPSGITLLKQIQTFGGMFIVAQSLWAIISPSLGTVLGFTLMFLVAGIYNLIIAVMNSGLLAGLLGIAQLWWAYKMYSEYQHFKYAQAVQPQIKMKQFYEEVFNTVTSNSFKDTPLSIDIWIVRNRWDGLLLENWSIFAFKRHGLLIVRPKSEVNFTPERGNPFKRRRVYGHTKLNLIFEKSMMKRDSFEKYTHWKGQEAVLEAVRPTLWQRLPRPIRVAILIIGGLILLYIGVMIVAIIQLIIQYN